MAAQDAFDQKIFLAKVGAGKAVLKFLKNQNVFQQGDVADKVFYIQKGKVKTVPRGVGSSMLAIFIRSQVAGFNL